MRHGDVVTLQPDLALAMGLLGYPARYVLRQEWPPVTERQQDQATADRLRAENQMRAGGIDLYQHHRLRSDRLSAYFEGQSGPEVKLSNAEHVKVAMRSWLRG
jgi:hypothetical protein